MGAKSKLKIQKLPGIQPFSKKYNRLMLRLAQTVSKKEVKSSGLKELYDDITPFLSKYNSIKEYINFKLLPL